MDPQLTQPTYSRVQASTTGAERTSAAARSRSAWPTVAQLGIVSIPGGRRLFERTVAAPVEVDVRGGAPVRVQPEPPSGVSWIAPSPLSALKRRVYRSRVQPCGVRRVVEIDKTEKKRLNNAELLQTCKAHREEVTRARQLRV